MQKFCLQHGFNNPECKCGDNDYVTSSQGPGETTPMSRADATRIVDLNFINLQALAFVLGIFGYDVVIRIEGEFRAPLQKKPRTLVPTLDTNAPVHVIMLAIEFVRR